MATGKITIDEGTTTNLATNTISEDAVTKHVSRSIINNSSGTEVTSWPTTVVDGGNVVLGAKADAKSTSTDTTAITIMQVLKEISYMEQNPASRAVTNAGTFATQNTDSIVSATFVVNTIDFTASQTAATLWDPAAGKKFVITDIVCSASAAGAITIFDATDTTALRVAKFNLAVNGGAVVNYRKPYVSATADNILKYTTGSGIAGSITVSGYEI